MNKFMLKKIIRAFLKAGLFFMLLAIIVAECIFVFASTPYGEKTARHILASAITENTGARAEIGGISGNLVGSLVIDDLRIFGPEGKSPVVSAGRIRASYDLLALLFSEVSIRHLEFDRMFVCLDMGKNREITLSGMNIFAIGPERKQAKTPGLDIHIGDIAVKDCGISITDRSAQQQVVHNISHISGRAGVRVGKKVFVSIDTLSFTPDRSYPRVSNLSGTISGMQKRFSFDLVLNSRKTLITLAGQVRHEGKTWDLPRVSGRISHLNPATLPFFSARNFPGDISADLSLSGTDVLGQGRKIEIKAVSPGMRLAGYGVDKGRFDCVIAGDNLRAKEIELSAPWGQVRASGEIIGMFAPPKDKLVTFQARVDGLDPALVFIDKGFPANLNLFVTASGRVPASLKLVDSEFSGKIALLDSGAVGITHVTGKLSAAYKAHSLRVGSLELASSGGKVIASGSVDFQTRACASTFSAQIADSKSFAGLMDAGDTINALSGRISVAGTLTGTIDRPIIAATLDGTGLSLYSSTARALRITGKWKDGPSFGVISCRTRVTGFSAGALRLSNLFFETSATKDEIRVSGVAEAFDARLHAKANLENWRSNLKTLTITHLALDAKDYPSITNTSPFNVVIYGNNIEVHPVELSSGKAKLNFSGRMLLAPHGKIALNAYCRDFDLERIAPFFKGVKDLSGRAEARIKVANTLEDPEANADIRISGSTIMGIRFSDVHLSVDGKKGEYKVMVEAQRDGKKAVALSGTIFLPVCLYPFSAQTGAGRMDLSLRVSDFSLAGIDLPFSDDVLVKGEVFADARITGNFTAPTAAGDIRFSNGSVVVKSLGLSYETCDGEIRFSQNRAQVVGLNIKGDKEGSLFVSGTIAFSGLSMGALDLSVSGKNFYVPFQNAAFLRTESDLTLTGTAILPVLKGRITVTKGTVDLLRLFSQKPAEIAVVNAPKNGVDVLELPEKPKQPGFLEPLTADINVTIEKNVWLKGKDEDIEIKGRVNVKKRPDHLFVVLGQADAVRGTYTFRNRLFQITDGRLTFQGAEEIDPVVNITGQTRISPVDIIVHLTGIFSKLNLSLESEPAMEKVDIISYLMFGRAVSDLSSGESFRAQDAALSMAGQLAADQLKDILGKYFHLDVVQVNAGSGDIRQGNITVGKYVAPKVFVTYSQGFSQTGGKSVDIDYEINRHFSIKAQTGEETTSALDLIWRHDF